MKKAIWTLRLNNYGEELVKLTYPLIKFWAKKIGAEFNVIEHEEFPGWPVTYQKLAINRLGRDYDWNIYIDSDAVVLPEMFDPTDRMKMDEVAHNANDMAGIRWRYDEYFRRDGRNIGSCDWFACASRWCLDLWRPLDDLTLEQVLDNIYPTTPELRAGITKEHLIDDYTCSRNIARFGLKFNPIIKQLKPNEKEGFFWHHYTIPMRDKIINIRRVLEDRGIAIGDKV